MDLRNVDFNLLLPLRALLEERSVSRAAERMQMSQPALSAALARLRRHFGDELLSRTGNRYELTPLAIQLLERSRSATRGLERVFTAQADFDPSTSTREFSLFSSDYGVAMLGGALATVITESAPSVTLRFHPMSSTTVDHAPESIRDHDGMLMPHGFLTNVRHQDLFVDRWVCVVSPGNTRVGARLELSQLSELPWVFSFTSQTQFTPAAKQMEMLGISPRVEIGVPGFLAVPSLVAGTDRIALLQEGYARRAEAVGAVRVLECPFDVVPFRESFWWNEVHDRDPEHVWLRSMLRTAVRRAGLPEASVSPSGV